MKNLTLALLFFSFNSFAESIDINDLSTDTESSTTIEISKGSSKDGYKIVEVSDEIMGDANLMVKEARKNWNTACADWKKETKEMNADNKVISLSCGKMNCTKEGAVAGAAEHVCSSKTKLVVKTKVR